MRERSSGISCRLVFSVSSDSPNPRVSLVVRSETATAAYDFTAETWAAFKQLVNSVDRQTELAEGSGGETDRALKYD
jgi:hypothetical protein